MVKVLEQIGRRRMGRQLFSDLRRRGHLRIDHAYAATKGVQLARSPRQLAQRRMLARRLLREVQPRLQVHDGYVRFSVRDLPHGAEALAACQAIAGIEKAAYDPARMEKKHLRTLLRPATLLEQPAIMRFATSPEIVAVVTKYLGTVPVLGELRLWWSVHDPGDHKSSQLFHQDNEDYRQLKVFVNIQPVTDRDGPFTFIPAGASAVAAKQVEDRWGRVSDDELFRHVKPEDAVILTGQAGEGAMVDTARCFHYGSRTAEGGDRLMLMLHYLGYHHVAEPLQKVLSGDVREAYSVTPLARAVLRSRPSPIP